MHPRQHAYVAHRCTGRLRLKVPAQRHNGRYFANLRRQLGDHPEIVRIEVNPLTASVLILHREGFDLQDLRNQFLGLELDCAERLPVVRRPAARPIARLDSGLRQVSGGEVDLAAVIMKVALAVITRGSVLQVVQWIAEAVLRAAIKSVIDPDRQTRNAVQLPSRQALLAAA
ncbi:HMA2 domain-containing protein [Microvirga massiliensis]|uniref:HMA2 domain-containing protein n=1 Tax=Microvirga massiliensis TaxID=1033741 RepID=UPI0011CACADC|nr:hypothetical protein [Microvirga massiliensis]